MQISSEFPYGWLFLKKTGDKVELKKRNEKTFEIVDLAEAIKRMK